MLPSAAFPVLPIDVETGPGLFTSRVGSRLRIELNDPPVLTGGSGAVFTVSTGKNATLRTGFYLSVCADRSFSGTPRLQIDANAQRPWLSPSGQPLSQIEAGRVYQIFYDGILDAMRCSTYANVTDTSDAQKVASGPIADALATKADAAVTVASLALKADLSSTTAILAGKADAAATASAIDQIRLAASGGGVVFQSASEANSHLAYPAYTVAQVVADPGGTAVNGVYQKQGASGAGSWQRIADLSVLISGLDAVFRASVKNLALSGPLANENGLLLIPPMRYSGLGSPTLYSPAPVGGFQQGFWEVYVGAYPDAAPQIVYLNTASGQVAVAGNSEDPFFADVGSAAKPVIALIYANAIHTPFQIATNRPNEFAYANLGYAPIVDANTKMAYTGDPVLNSYGIGRIYIATNGKPLVGGAIRRPGLNQQYFMRVWMLSDIDNDFPQLTAYAADAIGLTYSRDVFKLEKQYSPRVASFINVTRSMIGAQQAVSLLAGVTGGSGRNIGIMLQYAVAPEASLWVSRQDIPLPSAEENTRLRVAEGSKANKLIYGSRLALIEGRPQALFPMAVTLDRDLIGPVASVSIPGPADMSQVGFSAQGRDAIMLDPARIADAAAGRILIQRPAPWAGAPLWTEFTADVTPKARLAGKTLKIMFGPGDSWTEGHPTWRLTRDLLKACGVTVQLVGTMFRGAGDGGSVDGNDQREGRSGIAAADYIFKRTGFASPVTDPAGYMALGFADKRAKNPFLFPSSATGSYNGWRFDFGQYLAVPQYGLAVPDIAVIDILTNDVQYVPSPAVPDAIIAYCKESLGVMVPSIRAAGTKVLLVAHGQGFTAGGNPLWEDQRARGIITAMRSYVDGLNDPGVRFASAYGHMDQIGWGDLTTTGVDALTGAKTGTITDFVHPGQVTTPTQQWAECVAAHVAAML